WREDKVGLDAARAEEVLQALHKLWTELHPLHPAAGDQSGLPTAITHQQLVAIRAGILVESGEHLVGQRNLQRVAPVGSTTLEADTQHILLAVHLLLGGHELLNRVAGDLRLIVAQQDGTGNQEDGVGTPELGGGGEGPGEDDNLDGTLHVLKLDSGHRVALASDDAADLGDATTKRHLLASPLLGEQAGIGGDAALEDVGDVGQRMGGEIEAKQVLLPGEELLAGILG